MRALVGVMDVLDVVFQGIEPLGNAVTSSQSFSISKSGCLAQIVCFIES